MKTFNLKMSIKAQDGQGVPVSHADQFQKQFSTYTEGLYRYLAAQNKWKADHLMKLLWKTDPQMSLSSKIYLK